MVAFNESEHAALIETARSFAPRIHAMRDAIEQGRTLPLPLVREMAAAGLFRLMVPRSYGGLEVDPVTAIRVIEEIARADGSAGWSVMIGTTGGYFVGLMNERLAREIYEPDRNAVLGGSLNGRGKAVPVEGGYRVTGRWSFVSGIQHAGWAAGGSIVTGADGAPLPGPDGQPQMRVMVFPAAAITVIDTWMVGGLRGTGSHDFGVTDVFVPKHRTFAVGEPPVQPGPLYSFPAYAPSLVAAVALGIARSAIDALIHLAGAKTPSGEPGTLRERPLVQLRVAQAEALLRGARAFLLESVSEAWQMILAERTPTLEHQALIPLAATDAVVRATEAVDLMYAAGGSSVLHTDNPLERALRDVHAVGQHAAVQQVHYQSTGRVLLGLQPDRPIGLQGGRNPASA